MTHAYIDKDKEEKTERESNTWRA